MQENISDQNFLASMLFDIHFQQRYTEVGKLKNIHLHIPKNRKEENLFQNLTQL